jgi:hypothetical protein
MPAKQIQQTPGQPPFRSQFAVAKSLTQSLSWAAWHSKTAAHTASHSARTAPERHAPASARAANDREPRSPLRAYWSVYELTHRASGSRRAAGSRSTRTECPRLCWHTNFICGNPQRYGKPLKQRGCLPRSSGQSSRCWCQQDSVFARSGCLWAFCPFTNAPRPQLVRSEPCSTRCPCSRRGG